ncbi:hypothetical protein [Thermus scotoductus]|uniref:YggT family protein n=1 Tax=Thermus scotoductus TaxID=37636 RepID=A0A430UVI7_THESC|nr:hypothetical protein [Thermus scotoductus]RTI13106.1 hypothetical protein CSW27_09120 [Thermus scotoductus]
MGALIQGLLDLFQWLAKVVGAFFTWLWTTITGVLGWVWSVIDWVLATAWNWFIEFLQWALNLLFMLIGWVAVLPVKVLGVLVALLPPMPPQLNDVVRDIVVPALSLADRILPVSDAIAVLSLWGVFYGAMAIWRIVTFLRGGR